MSACASVCLCVSVLAVGCVDLGKISRPSAACIRTGIGRLDRALPPCLSLSLSVCLSVAGRFVQQ